MIKHWLCCREMKARAEARMQCRDKALAQAASCCKARRGGAPAMQRCRPCWQRLLAQAPGLRPRWAARPLLPRPRLHTCSVSTNNTASAARARPAAVTHMWTKMKCAAAGRLAASSALFYKTTDDSALRGGAPASARLAAMAAARSSSSCGAAAAGRERVRSATSVPSCMPRCRDSESACSLRSIATRDADAARL